MGWLDARTCSRVCTKSRQFVLFFGFDCDNFLNLYTKVRNYIYFIPKKRGNEYFLFSYR
jgi:hypothetical protein